MKSIALFLCAIFSLSGSAQSNPQDIVQFHETIKIESKVLNEERVINIWTPENYKESNITYDVLYMADGGVKEDFPHVANTISKMILDRKITPIILVGIENTERRRDLTGFTQVEKDKKIAAKVGESAEFRKFIQDELFPEITKKYRITDRRGILGESAAGLFVTETFLLHPEMFDFYIAFDPSLWWNDGHLVKNAAALISKFPKKDIRFWFAGSGAKDVSPHTKKLAKVLAEQNFSQLQWHYADEPKEKHTTIFRNTKEKSLIWALTK